MSQSSLLSSSSSGSKKSIRFCEENNEVHYQEHFLSKKERKPLHYSAQELSDLKSDIYMSIDKFQRNPRINRLEVRGLESMVDGNYEEILERKQDYLGDVLAMYSECVQDGDMPLEQKIDLVGRFAANRTKADRKEALKKARQDKTAASKVYKEDNMRFKRTASTGFKRTASTGAKNFVASLVPRSFSRGLKPKRIQRTMTF